jgi:hypothetical protein
VAVHGEVLNSARRGGDLMQRGRPAVGGGQVTGRGGAAHRRGPCDDDGRGKGRPGLEADVQQCLVVLHQGRSSR